MFELGLELFSHLTAKRSNFSLLYSLQSFPPVLLKVGGQISCILTEKDKPFMHLLQRLRNSSYKYLLLLLFPCLIWTVSCTKNDQLPDQVDYNFHIKPILSQNCYTCHGPDPSSREADLRLDIFEGATAENEDGEAAIVPGKPRQSTLLTRVTSHEPDVMMPPPSAKKILSESEVALLEKWIRQGAKWKEHWSFIPPKKSRIPRAGNSTQANNEIDRFILKDLKEKGIQPNDITSKNQLIRRLSFSLTGLPPTLEEVQAFIEEESPNAYEKQVDRLIASTHFGEKWARHWMDLMRYAETKGHEFDYNIGGAWRYRDYLIRAFNADLPYDRLIQEHLAGDLIEPRWHPTEQFNEAKIGTAYYYMSEGKHSPVDVKVEESDIIDNAIDVTSKSFQALTIACAKCHDHKFDPIPTTDYYAMYGMFESSRFSPHPVQTTPQKLKTLEEIEAIKKSIRSQMAETFSKDPALIASINKDNSTQFIHKVSDTPERENSVEGITVFEDFRDGEWENWFSDGKAFGDKPLVGEPILDEEGQKIIGMAEPKASSRTYGPGIQGSLRSSNFILSSNKITVRAKGKGSIIRIIMDNFQIIRNPIYGDLEKKVDTEELTNFTMDVSMWKGRKAYVEIMAGKYNQHVYNISPDAYIDAEYVIFHDTLEAIPPIPLSNQVSTSNGIKAWEKENISSTAIAKINEYLQENPIAISPAVQELQQAFTQKSQTLFDPTHIMGMQEGEAVLSHVFIRGDFNNLSEEPAERRFLREVKAVDAEIPKEGSGRLAFAQAIANPDNPLTARVMVNRLWHHLFGRGIVETVDNFGVQGKLPTHPELLDYLAIKFVEEDWSIKKMIKFMVMSQTFQRSTEISETAAQNDPQNLYLSHFPVKRVDAESIRDAMLSVSGCLDLTPYGPSIPIHLTEFMKGRGRPRTSGPLDGEGRRSIYTSVRRNFLSPMMLVFDMPIPFSTFGKRNVSNVPAQSLTLMNDPFVSDQALMWARNLLASTDKVDERISQIYMQAFSREASETELAEAKTFLKEQAAIYGLSENQMLNDYRPWKDYCHTIMNMKEFIFLM